MWVKGIFENRTLAIGMALRWNILESRVNCSRVREIKSFAGGKCVYWTKQEFAVWSECTLLSYLLSLSLVVWVSDSAATQQRDEARRVQPRGMCVIRTLWLPRDAVCTVTT